MGLYRCPKERRWTEVDNRPRKPICHLRAPAVLGPDRAIRDCKDAKHSTLLRCDVPGAAARLGRAVCLDCLAGAATGEHSAQTATSFICFQCCCSGERKSVSSLISECWASVGLEQRMNRQNYFVALTLLLVLIFGPAAHRSRVGREPLCWRPTLFVRSAYPGWRPISDRNSIRVHKSAVEQAVKIDGTGWTPVCPKHPSAA